MWYEYLLLVLATIIMVSRCYAQHIHKCGYFGFDESNFGIVVGSFITYIIDFFCCWYIIDWIINGF